jgi:hypothetical protein
MYKRDKEINTILLMQMIWENLDQSIQISNRYIGIIRSDKLMSYNSQIPHIQRLCDDGKVNDIVVYQSARLKQNGVCNFMGLINIHFCRETGELYIVDGQHRYEAIKIITHQLINIPVSVEIVVVDTLDEVKENYKILNKNTTLPDFPETIDKAIPEKVAMYFKDKYPTIWSKSSRARRPHIFFDYFQEALGVLTEHLEITTSGELQKIVEDYNLKLGQWNIEQYPDSKNLNDKILNKCKETGIYLGLYGHASDEYRYDWTKAILHMEKGIVVKKPKSTAVKKTAIPKKIKEDAWNTHVGKDKKAVLCICCRTTTIDTFNFHAGHIISESNGGGVTIDNIRPICSACNLSMGVRNMDEFVKAHYPNNIAKFSAIVYDDTIKKSWTIGIFSGR